MAEKRYEIVTFRSPSKKLRRLEIEIAWYAVGRPVEHWNLVRKISRLWLLYWNDNPGATLIFTDRKIEMTPDKMVLIPPDTLVSAETAQPFIHNFVEFSAASPFDTVRPGPLVLPAARYKPVFPEKYSLLQTSLLLYGLVEHVLAAVPTDSEFAAQRLFEARIQTVLKYMDENRMRKFSLAELARKVNLSESRFIPLFKKETGLSPREYWMKQHLSTVLRLLEDTTLSLAEIAEKTGFTDRSHLSRVVKAGIGLTPAQIRKQGHTPD